jgi:hypothetical protein
MAAATAAVCAECLTPLQPTASVTLRGCDLGDRRRPEKRLIPICLTCWLSDDSHDWDLDWISYKPPQRFRCDGCGRPMRVDWPVHRRMPYRWRCCCEQCFGKATLRRANARRRVRHEEMACAVCGERFVPGKSNAKTCSDRCRQQLHRARHLPHVASKADFEALRRGQRFVGRDGRIHQR